VSPENKAAITRMKADPYPLLGVRGTLPVLDAFYAAFGVHSGEKYTFRATSLPEQSGSEF
jgi:hypothetical protein